MYFNVVQGRFQPFLELFTSSCKILRCNLKFALYSNSPSISVSYDNFLTAQTHFSIVAIVFQRIIYGSAPPATSVAEEDELEEALALADS